MKMPRLFNCIFLKLTFQFQAKIVNYFKDTFFKTTQIVVLKKSFWKQQLVIIS